jgi:hypothetical protein
MPGHGQDARGTKPVRGAQILLNRATIFPTRKFRFGLYNEAAAKG